MKLLAACVTVSAMLIGCGTPAETPSAPTTTTTTTPTGTQIVREDLAGTISATDSPPCSSSFVSSVDPSYYAGGSQRCAEFPRSSTTSGMIRAQLKWLDRRIDLDLVLNNGAGMNFRQSIAANRCCEGIEFFVNGGTNYVFVVYLRGIDPIFLLNGGVFTGAIATPFTIEVERPL